ncbi:hypothetical protein Taro_039291 [Colocasia esculenta]|uniref:Uncharacterized protein n=1 Tax=Colocasia esculenta TaxID=4460 RepID=A0A843WIF3_COLES|nr:hypothetical protein [Colocasia esculenta]
MLKDIQKGGTYLAKEECKSYYSPQQGTNSSSRRSRSSSSHSKSSSMSYSRSSSSSYSRSDGRNDNNNNYSKNNGSTRRRKTLMGAAKGTYISLGITCMVGTVPVDTSNWKRNGSCWNHILVVAIESYWSIQN